MEKIVQNVRRILDLALSIALNNGGDIGLTYFYFLVLLSLGDVLLLQPSQVNPGRKDNLDALSSLPEALVILNLLSGTLPSI